MGVTTSIKQRDLLALSKEWSATGVPRQLLDQPLPLPRSKPPPSSAVPAVSREEGLRREIAERTGTLAAAPAAAPASNTAAVPNLSGAGTKPASPTKAAPAPATLGFGGAAAPASKATPPVGASTEPTEQPAAAGSHRERLVAFYKKHDPTKLENVDKFLVKYAGKEVGAVGYTPAPWLGIFIFVGGHRHAFYSA